MLSFVDGLHPERDVLVTGIGMVTPLGIGREESWQRLLQGERAGRVVGDPLIGGWRQLATLLGHKPAAAMIAHDVLANAAAEIRRQSVGPGTSRHCEMPDPLISLITLAASEACDDANVRTLMFESSRAGCVIGTSKSSLAAMNFQSRAARDPSPGPDADGWHWANVFRSDAPLQAVRELTAAAGPGTCPVAACATGLVSVIQAARLVRSGHCDICLAGSVDASAQASVMASFHRLGVLSKHEDPSSACRPFDATRDGFVIGEGAAVFVLESRKHAETRNAAVYGRLLSGGWLTDPTGLTQIDTDGTVVAEVLQRMMRTANDATGNDHNIDHFNLHGTGTEPNDLAEARGVRLASGTSAPACSAVKGSLGHLLGGAGSVELAMTLLSLRDQVLPPCVNLHSQDPCCDISLAGAQVTPLAQQRAAKLSLGFGGHVAGCVLERSGD